MAATPAALAGLAIGTSAVGAGSAAGQPTAQSLLLCGQFVTPTDHFSGASSIDHPDGSSSTGNTYEYTGQNCESNQSSSTGSYTWTLSHSNVHASETGTQPQAEFGTEHGQYALSQYPQQGGFNGRITNFDFSSNDNDGDSCGNRVVYYASGHQYDPGTCSDSGPGNANNHGGAATGNHFNGKYGTVVYQWGDTTSNSPCKIGSTSYCFEGILVGQVN